MDYVEQQSTLHEFAGNVEASEILAEAARGSVVDLDHVTGHGRRRAVRRVVERVGQENFRTRVLTVYDYCCAVCDVQLELVEAAHIVPVPAGGTNATSNGLALCSLHHEAYDRALIGIRPDYSVATNAAALRRLRRLHLQGGWSGFEENLREEMILPNRAQDRPDPAVLETGLRMRGWQ
jgi:putative restriction endonuclease